MGLAPPNECGYAKAYPRDMQWEMRVRKFFAFTSPIFQATLEGEFTVRCELGPRIAKESTRIEAELQVQLLNDAGGADTTGRNQTGEGRDSCKYCVEKQIFTQPGLPGGVASCKIYDILPGQSCNFWVAGVATGNDGYTGDWGATSAGVWRYTAPLVYKSDDCADGWCVLHTDCPGGPPCPPPQQGTRGPWRSPRPRVRS